MRAKLVLAMMGATLAAHPAAAAIPDDAVIARWIQLGPNALDAAKPEPTILARALTREASCPTLAIDGAPATMAPRFTPSTPTNAFPMPVGEFPVTACEATIPPGRTIATVGGVDLKLPVADPKRILVIADTGCRMKGAAQQDCQDPVAFPLAFLANFEALFRPDLIIHIGDYFYRDSGCPNVSLPTPCPNTKTQWGDNWASWSEDFFIPAKPLLAEAPWIMTRGNHEGCGRGANGWYHLLDPRPFSEPAANCTSGSPEWDFSPTYVVPTKHANFLVHDSSFANDFKADDETARRYEADLRHVLDTLGEQATPSVFLTHKPAYGMVKSAPDSAGNATEQLLFNGLFGGTVPKRIGLFLSGHIHMAQYVNFTDTERFAPQLIVGVGGSALDEPILPTSPRYELPPGSRFDFVAAPADMPSARVNAGHAQAEFGFAMLDATPTGFLAQVYTISGQLSGRCVVTLSPRKLDCAF